jgi:hypothetical protein
MRHVGANGDRNVQHRLELRQRSIQIARVARHHGDARPFACERLGAGESDALASAGDDDDLVLQVEVHIGPRIADRAKGNGARMECPRVRMCIVA